MKRTPVAIALVAFFIVALLARPGALPLPGREEATPTLVVFAAASLNEAFTDVGAAFEATHPGLEIAFNFAGSSVLAAQLAQGARADIFASADGRQMQAAQAAGRIAGPVYHFAGNRLVVAVPSANPAGVASLRDLARPGVLLVLAAPDVPVRAYTDRLLAQLAADPAYGEAYRQAVLNNVVSEEPNVRQVVAKIALGEVDAGIVYQTDVTPELADRVVAMPIPEAINPRAVYPIAVVAEAPHPALAQAFVAFVRSAAGQDILARWGFVVPPYEP